MDNNLDFALLFDQVILDYDWKKTLPQDCTYHSIYVFEESFPELDNVQIALFSIDDNRGTKNNVLETTSVRKQLYKLKKSNVSYQVADLGCLRPGPNYADTILRFNEVFRFLIHKGILPIIINSSQDFVFQSYKTMVDENLSEKINIALIDRKLDLDNKSFADENFVNELINYPSNGLKRLKLLAYQSYLVSPDIKTVFDKLSFEEIRLGALKKDILSAEPILRNCHIISMDASAIKSNEFPANATHSPFGLTVEEACQLTWFSGVSNSLKCFIFSGYREEEDLNELSAHGLAVQIWYVIEGFYARVKEDLSNDVTEFIVENSFLSEPITFVRSKKSEKWWVKIKNEFIPCSLKDYQQTQSGVLPDVWMREEWR